MDFKALSWGNKAFSIPMIQSLLKLIYFFQEEELKKHIYETESVMKTSCDLYKEKGDYYFQNEYYFFRHLHYSHTSWAQLGLE